MEGHLKHPPYSTETYLSDAAWVAALVVVPVLSWWLRLFGRWWWLSSVVLVLPVWRIVMGRFYGFGAMGFSQWLGLE